MPVPDPADRLHGDHDRHPAAGLIALPLRIGRRHHRFQLEFRQETLLLSADAVGVCPQMPIGYRRLVIHQTLLGLMRYGCDDANGLDTKSCRSLAFAPNASTRKPPASARFFRKSQKISLPWLGPFRRKPGTVQNCFQTSAVTMQ